MPELTPETLKVAYAVNMPHISDIPLPCFYLTIQPIAVYKLPEKSSDEK